MKRLIINADDFGLTPGITRGIIDAHLRGVVSSTSVLMNSPAVEESLVLAEKQAPQLGIGVHLVLTHGKPLLTPKSVPSLVCETGDFYPLPQFFNNIERLDFSEVYAEWKAQIESFLSTGRKPDHLDSHHHSSYASRSLFSVMLELAQRYQLPIRYPPLPEITYIGSISIERILEEFSVSSPHACITSFYGKSANLKNLTSILASIPEGTSELMCHPGYFEMELIKISSYHETREKELQVLTHPRVQKQVEKSGIRLCRFSDL